MVMVDNGCGPTLLRPPQERNRAAARVRALWASASRFFGGADVSSDLKRSAAILAILSTADAKGTWLAVDGV